MLLFIPLFILIIIASIIHNTIITNALNDKLKKLHASGIFIEMLKQEDRLFQNKKDFMIRIDKVELVAELLFGMRNNDPLMVHLSKLQGLKLNVQLSHTKFIFSNELVMYLSINTLPEYFANQSQLFTDLLLFSNANPELIQTRFNVWDNSFSFNIPELEHTFIAEHNLSYEVKLEDLSLYGYITNHSDFDIYNDCETFYFSMLKSNQKKSQLYVEDSSLNLSHIDSTISTAISFEHLDLNLSLSKPLTLQLEGFSTQQSFLQENYSDFSSVLNLDSLRLFDTKEIFSFKNLAYDVVLKHLDYATIAHIRELIHTSNTNTVVFISDDLSKDLETLIKYQAEINVNNLSFEDIYLNEKHYADAKLSLHAISTPENSIRPIDFTMDLHLSKPLYAEFLERVPNASLTKNFITDTNSSADFHLRVTEKGFILNQKDLLAKPKPDHNVSDNNQTDINKTL